LAQAVLDLLARHGRVAVGVEQALLGGQQRALAVDRDRSPLEHERRPIAGVPEQLHEAPADLGALAPGREPPAPAVEPESRVGHPRAPQLAPCRPRHQGPLVARPLGRHVEAVGARRGGTYAQLRAFLVRVRSSWRSTTLTIRRMIWSMPVALAWP